MRQYGFMTTNIFTQINMCNKKIVDYRWHDVHIIHVLIASPKAFPALNVTHKSQIIADIMLRAGEAPCCISRVHLMMRHKKPCRKNFETFSSRWSSQCKLTSSPAMTRFLTIANVMQTQNTHLPNLLIMKHFPRKDELF